MAQQDVAVSQLPTLNVALNSDPSNDTMIVNMKGNTETQGATLEQLRAFFSGGINNPGGPDGADVPRTYWTMNDNTFSRKNGQRWDSTNSQKGYVDMAAITFDASTGNSSGGTNVATTGVNADSDATFYKKIPIPKGCVGGYLYYTSSFNIGLTDTVHGTLPSGVHGSVEQNAVNVKHYGRLNTKVPGGTFVGYNNAPEQNGFQFRLQAPCTVATYESTISAQDFRTSDARTYAKFDYLSLHSKSVEVGYFEIYAGFTVFRAANCILNTTPIRFIFLPVFAAPSPVYLQSMFGGVEVKDQDLDTSDGSDYLADINALGVSQLSAAQNIATGMDMGNRNSSNDTAVTAAQADILDSIDAAYATYIPNPTANDSVAVEAFFDSAKATLIGARGIASNYNIFAG